MTAVADTAPDALLPIDQPMRLHPATLLLAIVQTGPKLAQMLPAVIALGVTGNWRFIAPALALFVLISVGFAWLAWTRFQWRIGADGIAIRSGVISRKDRVIPFDRIQDVTIEQGLVQRMLGLAKVGFETGSAGEKGDDGKLNAIALAQADALRDHVRDHRSPRVQPLGSDAADQAPMNSATPVAAAPAERALFSMGVGRLVHAGIYNFSLAVIGVLFGLLQTFDDLLPFDPFSPAVWFDLAEDSALASWLLAHQIVSGAAGLLGLILLGMATGVVRTLLRDWDFRLVRTSRGMRRTRGLATRTDVTIPLARVQAALVDTGWVRRIAGWYELKLQSLASDGTKESDHVVIPFARLDDVDSVLAELALDRAGFEDDRSAEEGEWHRSLFGASWIGPILLLALGVAQYVITGIIAPDLGWISVFAIAGAPLLLLLNWLAWRHRRWRLVDGVLHITSGVLSRRHIILPVRNVQSAEITIGPILRRIDGATLTFGVPGGGASMHRIEAIPMPAAYTLRARVLAA